MKRVPLKEKPCATYRFLGCGLTKDNQRRLTEMTFWSRSGEEVSLSVFMNGGTSVMFPTRGKEFSISENV